MYSTGGQFALENLAALTMFAFGVVPLAVTVMILESLYRGRVDWNERGIELVPAA